MEEPTVNITYLSKPGKIRSSNIFGNQINYIKRPCVGIFGDCMCFKFPIDLIYKLSVLVYHVHVVLIFKSRINSL